MLGKKNGKKDKIKNQKFEIGDESSC